MKISDFYSGLYPIREAKLQEIPKKLFPIFFKLSKTDPPLRFCKIGLRNTLFVFGRHMIVFFVCFVAILWSVSDFDLLIFD